MQISRTVEELRIAIQFQTEKSYLQKGNKSFYSGNMQQS